LSYSTNAAGGCTLIDPGRADGLSSSGRCKLQLALI